MRAKWLVLTLLLCCDIASGAPPFAAGFITGPDSVLYVYWVHPDIYCYEQGMDTTGVEVLLVPGDAEGTYAVASKVAFPTLAYLLSFSVNIYQGDLYEEQPGDQYSPFKYGVYRDHNDSCPLSPPIAVGANVLCGGGPCVEEWAENDVRVPNLSGERLWVAFQWEDSTPAAPQLRCLISPPGQPKSMFGTDDGAGFVWSRLNFNPAFRQRLLGLTALSLTPVAGWRRELPGAVPPDMFAIESFSADGVDSMMISRPDTLIHRLPFRAIDSVHIYSVYGGLRDESYAAAVFDAGRIAPIRTEIALDGYQNDWYDARFCISNLGEDSIELTIGYDQTVAAQDTVIGVPGLESVEIPCRVLIPPPDTGRVSALLQAGDRRYYPHLLSASFPDPGQTDAVDTWTQNGEEPVGLCIYPNPCMRRAYIYTTGMSATASVVIYNILGQVVARLSVPPGAGAVWDGRDRAGRPVPAGVYHARMAGKDGYCSKRLVILR